MLKPGGRLYISLPIGKKTEVHFNAHRIFHPLEVLSWAAVYDHLAIERFDFVDDRGVLHREVILLDYNIDVVFGCGIYTFINQPNSC